MGKTVVLGALTAFAVASLAAAPCRAQPSPADKARALTLFRQGRELMTTGKTVEACIKFGESDRLDPALGTHLNLAYCHELAGQTATAWTELGEVLDRADRAGDKDRVAFARQHLAEVEKKLSRLRIRAAVLAPGTTLKVDGRPIGQALDEPLPLDPGPHTIEAAAPGRQAWTHEVYIKVGPALDELLIPTLATFPGETASPPGPDPHRPGEAAQGAVSTEHHGNAGLRTASYVLGAAGVVGLGLGAYFGVRAASKNDESFANGHCDASGCDATGTQARNDALSNATVSTVAFVAGGVALASGVVLFVVSRDGSVQAAPTVGTTGGGMVVRGCW